MTDYLPPPPQGLGIYKRKEESKQETNQAFDKEKKNSLKKKRSRPRKRAIVQESVHEKRTRKRK